MCSAHAHGDHDQARETVWLPAIELATGDIIVKRRRWKVYRDPRLIDFEVRVATYAADGDDHAHQNMVFLIGDMLTIERCIPSTASDRLLTSETEDPR